MLRCIGHESVPRAPNGLAVAGPGAHVHCGRLSPMRIQIRNERDQGVLADCADADWIAVARTRPPQARAKLDFSAHLRPRKLHRMSQSDGRRITSRERDIVELIEFEPAKLRVFVACPERAADN